MIVNYQGREILLPDFLIVGAAKSGTTTLYHLLNQHPDVFIPRKKEPFYFCFEDQRPEYTDKNFTKNIIWELNKYLKLYEHAPANILSGDASTAYLYLFESSIRQIKKLYGSKYEDLKIIMILRNPAERAFSHYNFLLRDQIETLSFEDAINDENIQQRKSRRWGFDYLNYGNYYNQVKAYKDSFPKLKVLFFEELSNPKEMMKNIGSFLGLKNWEYEMNITSNPSGAPKNKTLVKFLLKGKISRAFVHLLPQKLRLGLMKQRDQMVGKLLVKQKMEKTTKKSLMKYYQKDIGNLEKLLGKDLNHWMNFDKIDG